MSVYLHAAVTREAARLRLVAEALARELPPAEVSLARSAIADLDELASHIRERLDARAREAG